MEMQSLRIRLLFEDHSVSQQQRFNRSWNLIEPNHHPKISDVCNHLLHKFNLCSSCPNGILLTMKGFVLPPSESTRILKDDDIVCVRRNEIALAEESSPKETTSKKRKASTKLRSSKTKKHPSPVMDGVKDRLAPDENSICQKKIKPNEEVKKENAEKSDNNVKDKVEGVEQTSTAPDGVKKVPSRSSRRKKAKRRWRQEVAKIAHNRINHVEPEVSNTEIKGANDFPEGPFKLPAKVLHKNIIKQEERYFDGDVDSKLVPWVVKPAPVYPIVVCKMEEDGPEKSLYKEDASSKVKFAALADVRSVKQCNSDAVEAASDGVHQTPQGDEKNVASNLMPNSNDAKANLSKDPSPVVYNKDGNLPDEIGELLIAKKSELM